MSACAEESQLSVQGATIGVAWLGVLRLLCANTLKTGHPRDAYYRKWQLCLRKIRATD